MPVNVSTFELRVLLRDLGESWTDEAVVLIDGVERLALVNSKATDGWSGRRPDAIIGAGSPLLTGLDPADVFVAVCGCGMLGCGALIARISATSQGIVWDKFREGSDARSEETPVDLEAFLFDADEYERVVLGHSTARSAWEPTTRRAALQVNGEIAGEFNESLRLRFAGAGSAGESVSIRAFLGVKGDPDRALLSREFALDPGESHDGLAARVLAYMASGAILDDELVTRREF